VARAATVAATRWEVATWQFAIWGSGAGGERADERTSGGGKIQIPGLKRLKTSRQQCPSGSSTTEFYLLHTTFRQHHRLPHSAMSATYCHIPSNVTITGCAVALFRGVDEIMVCEENRVVLSYQEQQALNSKQPYMLPSPTTLDHYGNPIPSTRLGRLLHKRMNKRKKMDDIEIKDEEALALVSQAQLNHARFAMQG